MALVRKNANVWAGHFNQPWPLQVSIGMQLHCAMGGWYHADSASGRPVHATLLAHNQDGTATVALEPGFTVPPHLLAPCPQTPAQAATIAAADAVYDSNRLINMTFGFTPVAHTRNPLGWLCCSKCAEAFEYAEPPAAGPYVCRGCKLWEAIT